MDYFLGLDISLTSTGYCVRRCGETVLEGSIKTSSNEDWLVRIDRILTTLDSILNTYQPKLVLIENYSFGSTFGRELLGEIHGIIMYVLHRRNIPFIKVSPTQVKLYGTGRGTAPPLPQGRAKSTWKKVWVVEAVNTIYDRAFRLADNDICDAFIIALLAETVYNVQNKAVDVQVLPKHQREAVEKILNVEPKKAKTRRKTNGKGKE